MSTERSSEAKFTAGVRTGPVKLVSFTPAQNSVMSACPLGVQASQNKLIDAALAELDPAKTTEMFACDPRAAGLGRRIHRARQPGFPGRIRRRCERSPDD